MSLAFQWVQFLNQDLGEPLLPQGQEPEGQEMGERGPEYEPPSEGRLMRPSSFGLRPRRPMFPENPRTVLGRQGREIFNRRVATSGPRTIGQREDLLRRGRQSWWRRGRRVPGDFETPRAGGRGPAPEEAIPEEVGIGERVAGGLGELGLWGGIAAYDWQYQQDYKAAQGHYDVEDASEMVGGGDRSWWRGSAMQQAFDPDYDEEPNYHPGFVYGTSGYVQTAPEYMPWQGAPARDPYGGSWREMYGHRVYVPPAQSAAPVSGPLTGLQPARKRSGGGAMFKRGNDPMEFFCKCVIFFECARLTCGAQWQLADLEDYECAEIPCVYAA